MEMQAKDWVALAGIVATATMAIVTLLVNRHRERLQQERDDRLRKEQQAREDMLLEEQRKREEERQKKERTYVPQIEFSIDCNFYGPQQDSYIVEVLLTAHNKGRVKQEFRNLILRIRGITKEQPLTHWKGREPRLYFPEPLVDNKPVIPEGVDHFFAEPGDKVLFTYVTSIPASINYILAYATYKGEEGSHDTERVFPVKAP